MSSATWIRSTILVGAVIAGPGLAGDGGTVFVSSKATGTQDGTSWADAYADLSAALAAALPGDAVWVARGTYAPGTQRSASFYLRSGVKIFGGFAGTEDPESFDLTARDLSTSETVLDGRLSSGERAFHVITARDADESAVLDGCTIFGGRADGVAVNRQDVGGGALIIGGAPVFRWCRFVDNEAGTQGGAVHVDRAGPTFVHCTFVSNRSTVTQGEYNVGGAFYATGSTLAFARPTLINCLFMGNAAGVGNGGSGGAIYATPSTLVAIVNCTIVHNLADTDAGGIWGSPTVVGSVVWSNLDRLGRGRSSQIGGSAVVSYSCVEGGWNGEGNTAEDPLFLDPAGMDGAIGTADDNLRLLPGSPCIDAGTNEGLIASLSTDLDGVPRFVDDPVTKDRGIRGGWEAVVDMGAFEYQAECRTAEDCDDRRLCNGLEGCNQGRCVPGVAVACDDGVACMVGRCEESDRACTYTPVDALCDNGLHCDGKEICTTSGCSPGQAVFCQDAVACTIDRCDESAAGCVFEPVDAVCDNGDPCDGEETCIVGQGCVSSGPVDCDDFIDCTLDACGSDSGECLHQPRHSLCDDGVFCNGSETCELDGCHSSGPPCVEESFCDEKLDRCVACLFTEHCDDQNQCTSDVCNDGTCENLQIAGCCVSIDECDDGNVCTDNTCEGGACVALNNSAPCDDGDDCTDDDICRDGLCAGTEIPGCGGVTPPPPPPSDGDGDGVPDASDQCPGTLTGQDVDGSGCPVDPPPGQTVIDDGAQSDPPPAPDLDPDPDFDSGAGGENGGSAPPGLPVVTDEPESGQSVPDDPLSGEDAVDAVALNRASCGACGAGGSVSMMLTLIGLVILRFRAQNLEHFLRR